jgi:hypothetical protein
MDIYKSLNGGGLEIEMSPELINKAGICIKEMLRLG